MHEDRGSATGIPLRAFALLMAAMLSCAENEGEEIVVKQQALMSIQDAMRVGTNVSGMTATAQWETVALAVPPNTAGCGADGAVFFKVATLPGDSSGIDGDLVPQVWKGKLSCFRNGEVLPNPPECAMTAVEVPRPTNYVRNGQPQTFMVGGNDARMGRMPDGTLVLLSQGTAYSAGRFEPRGTQGFYVSTDCGKSWTNQSVIDPKFDFSNGLYHHPAHLSGLDYPAMAIDPWRSIIYAVVFGNGVERADAVLFVSRDGARTWTAVVDPSTGISSLPKTGPYAITTLPSGEAVIFTCNAGNPTLFIYNSTTGVLGGAQTFSAGTCSGFPIPNPDRNLTDHSESIGRVFTSDPNVKRVRVLYPQTVGGVRQRLRLIHVNINANGTVSTVSGTSRTFDATAAGGSLLFGNLIEPDYLDMAITGSDNPALAYWIETSLTNTTGSYSPAA